MEAQLDVKKMNAPKPIIKRIEIEYKDMNYIIVNLVENVIDVNGELYEYNISSTDKKKIEEFVWSYRDLNEYDYWPEESVKSVMWRIAWYDEFDTYYHKSGALKYPDNFMDLVNLLKSLK